MSKKRSFWKVIPFDQMTPEQWESLCDKCGRCCLYKFEDVDTHEFFYTNVACRFLDLETCRCTVYSERKEKMASCVILSPAHIPQLKWLPETCAYRLIAEGKNLPKWHPLVSGDPYTVHTAGISIRNKVIPEQDIDIRDLEDYVVHQIKPCSQKNKR